MKKIKMIKQIIMYLSVLINVELFAQDQLDMTVLFDYFDSTVTIYVDGDEIVIEGDGVPSHYSPYFVQTYSQTNNGMYYWQDNNGDGVNDLWMQTPSDMNLNPNRIAQRNYEFRIPLYPEVNPNGPTDTFLGPIGISINGVPFFNEYESPTQTVTNQVIQSFDPGNGHPAPQGNYHYHFPPESLITVTEDNFLGFAGDGFPVYGPKNPDGNNVENLDDFHGEYGPTPDFPDSIYHYHTNYTQPYIIGAFAGTLGTGFGGAGGGGGGGGGNPPDCNQVPPGMPCCGDGTCGGPETETNCPVDCATAIEPTILVNEFLALNDACCTDPNGEYDDYIELYNYGNESVDIGGYLITDNIGDYDNYHQIPIGNDSTIIQPGEIIILWADKDSEQGVLHLEIKLSGSGEQVALFMPDSTTVVDTLSFGEQTVDVSYGRYPDGSDTWQQMNPTPGASNTQELFTMDSNTMPNSFKLYPAYPNPFNPETTISYDLPEQSFVEITIYDMLGKKVRSIVNEKQNPGHKSILWNAKDDYGTVVSAGLYIYQVQADNFIQTNKMILLK